MGETVKKLAPLEVPGFWGRGIQQEEALRAFSQWEHLDGEEWAGLGLSS